MKKLSFAAIIMAFLFLSSCAGLEGLSLGNTNNSGGSNASGGVTNSEVIRGLKEALKIGSQNASKTLSAKDGFLRDAAVKILLPPEAQQVEKTLRSIGMGSLVDDAIVSMNRAAEDAAVKAAPIFVNAITSMTITDGMNILRGGDNAATNYLKGKTTVQLTNAFRPVIQSSLTKIGTEKIWASVFNTYNKLPTVKNKINPDLTGYVTERALSGLFLKVGNEEAKIRKDPAAQVTDLLRKVFGNK